HRSVRLVILVGLAIDQIAQSGLSSLSVIYYSAQLFRAQAILADVMIDVIRSKENGEDRNIQLIIETHSEHFLRRLQRRIAEDEIDKTKVSAYFSDFSSEQPKLTSLIIDSFGNIQNWPEHFFGDDMGDISAQSKAALKKRMEQLGIKK
ncbi:DUF3696 domain-containing protein, partial [Serratia nevei]|uniref:DUF3696 domain-containing protein n=1 Tax=Serratia nevei TaxID=2703794 RepID=UPI00254C8BA4